MERHKGVRLEPVGGQGGRIAVTESGSQLTSPVRSSVHTPPVSWESTQYPPATWLGVDDPEEA